MKETAIAILLCNLLNGGETEQRVYFPNLGEDRYVKVDCETPTHVIEIGMDGKADARDSVHQAVFSSLFTGKTPMVIIIDQDGVEGRYEYEIRRVSEHLGIAFGSCKGRFLQAWSASSPFRNVKGRNDLPSLDVAKRHCDLAGEFGDEVPPVFPVLGVDKQDLFADDPVAASFSE